MKKRRMEVSILIFVFLILSSCVIVVHDRSNEERVGSSEKYWKRIPFSAGGRIYLENRNGEIEIMGWENDEVEIMAEQEGIGREDIRFREAADFDQAVRVKREDDSLWINTEIPDQEGETGAVDYLIRVPHSVDFEIKTNGRSGLRIKDIYGRLSTEIGEGDVRVENFSGSIEISLVTGSVEAEVLDIRSEDTINIATTQGDIVLSLQEEASAGIEADAPGGRISSDFDIQPTPSAHKLTTRIGGGEGASISLRTLNGDIKIRKTQ